MSHLESRDGAIALDKLLEVEAGETVPAFLPAAKDGWKKPKSYARATLSTVCLPMLALYCDTYASYRELTDFIREHGSSYTNEKGWQAPRPEVSLQTQKAKLMLILAKEFGFTPGSQSRIAIVPQRDEAAERDPIEAARQALRREQGMRTNSPTSPALEPRLKRLP